METNRRSKKIILFGAGHVGMLALSYFGAGNVYCFADNAYDKREHSLYCGKRIISFDQLKEIHKDYHVVIALRDYLRKSAIEQCEKNGVPFDCYFSLINVNEFESRPDIAAFKGVHKGERCFIIGNGPSLRHEDLEMIYANGGISFGCNLIHKIFDRTSWRPDYYFSDHYKDMLDADSLNICGTKANFFSADRSNVFGESTFYKKTDKKIISYYRLHKSDALPDISEDPSKYLIAFGTVMYIMLQFAMYFGFAEIVLLGFDATAVDSAEKIKYDRQAHFYDNSVDKKFVESLGERYAVVEKDAVTKGMIAASESARKYADSKGIKILYATLGGKLSAFERVELNSLF